MLRKEVMMRRLYVTSFWNLIMFFLVTGCTEVEMINETPQGGNVQFSYDWSGVSVANMPDSMAIIAVRVVNHYKCGMMQKTTGSPLLGHYFYNPPEHIEAWVDPSTITTPPPPRTDNTAIIDPSEPYSGGVNPGYFTPEGVYVEPTVDKTAIKVDHFMLPSGTYKFYAMGMDNTASPKYDHVYTNVNNFIRAAGTGMQYSEMEMIYNVHHYEDDDFVNLIGKDYNPGFDIIQTDYPAIYADQVELLDVKENNAATITIQPKPLTQNIDINLSFKKNVAKPFTIEKVVGEMSGIPSKATVFDGHLYLAKTNKMQFSTTVTDGNGNPDSDTNTDVRVHANINVLSILHSDKPTDLTGPGIMQMAVTYKTKEIDSKTGLPYDKRWTVRGRINLYNTLKEAKLITYSDDWQYAYKSSDHAVLNIPTTIEIRADGTISSGTKSTDGGIDEWNQWGDATTDDGNGVELY